MVNLNRFVMQFFIIVATGPGHSTVVADNPFHIGFVDLVFGESADFAGHQSGNIVGGSGHNPGDGGDQIAAFCGIIGIAQSQQQGCGIGNPETGGPEQIAFAGDIFGGKLAMVN